MQSIQLMYKRQTFFIFCAPLKLIMMVVIDLQLKIGQNVIEITIYYFQKHLFHNIIYNSRMVWKMSAPTLEFLLQCNWSFTEISSELIDCTCQQTQICHLGELCILCSSFNVHIFSIHSKSSWLEPTLNNRHIHLAFPII